MEKENIGNTNSNNKTDDSYSQAKIINERVNQLSHHCCGTNNLQEIDKIVNDNNDNSTYNPKFIYNNSYELQILMEKEFEEIIEEVKLIYDNNKEMLEYDPNDYDLLQAIEDNLVIISNKLEVLRQIQVKLNNLSPGNPISKFDIMSVFGDKIDSKEVNDKNDKINEVTKIENRNSDNKLEYNNKNVSMEIEKPNTSNKDSIVDNMKDVGGLLQEGEKDELLNDDECLQELDL